ncbi:hypothetical protein CRYUN_Cryun04dG0133500 [Craigia yunnanensis]
MFALVVYDMVIFSNVLEHVEATVVDLLEQVSKNHFWEECEVPLKPYLKTFILVNEFCKKEWSKNKTSEKWNMIFQGMDRIDVHERNHECLVDLCFTFVEAIYGSIYLEYKESPVMLLYWCEDNTGSSNLFL